MFSSGRGSFIFFHRGGSKVGGGKRAAPTGRRTFAALYPGAEKDAVDLLENLIKMDPAQRYSADQCLDHAYLKPIRGANDLLAPPDALDSVDPGPSLGLPQIRRLIRDHARGFAQVAGPSSRRRRSGALEYLTPDARLVPLRTAVFYRDRRRRLGGSPRQILLAESASSSVQG